MIEKESSLPGTIKELFNHEDFELKVIQKEVLNTPKKE